MFDGFNTQKERETHLLKAKPLAPKQVERKQWLASDNGQLSMQFDKLHGERVVFKAQEMFEAKKIEWTAMWEIKAPPSIVKYKNTLFDVVSSAILLETLQVSKLFSPTLSWGEAIESAESKVVDLVSSISSEAFSMLDNSNIPELFRSKMMQLFVARVDQQVVKEAISLRFKMLVEQKSVDLTIANILLRHAPHACFELKDLCGAISRIVDSVSVKKEYTFSDKWTLSELLGRIFQDVQDKTLGVPADWLFRTDQLEDDDDFEFISEEPQKERASYCWLAIDAKCKVETKAEMTADELKNCVDIVRSSLDIYSTKRVQEPETADDKRDRALLKLPEPSLELDRCRMQEQIDDFNEMLFASLRSHPAHLAYCLHVGIIKSIFDKKLDSKDSKDSKETKCLLLATLAVESKKRTRWDPDLSPVRARHEQKLCECYCSCEKCWLTCCDQLVQSLEPKYEGEQCSPGCQCGCVPIELEDRYEYDHNDDFDGRWPL